MFELKKRFAFTERGLAGLPPSQAGKRDEYFDLACPGLGVRINEKPKTKVQRGDGGREILMPRGQFILYAGIAGSGRATRRSLGRIEVMPLAEARKAALAQRA